MAKLVKVTGNTYPVRDKIRALGGWWDAGIKTWLVPEDKAEEARKLVADAPAKVPGNKPHFDKCHECGRPSRGYYRCYECSPGYRDGGGMYNGGMSYYDRNGNFVLGDDD